MPDQVRISAIRFFSSIIYCTALTALFATNSAAQAVAPVSERQPPGYENIPVRLGSLILTPSLTASTAYESNYLALPSSEKSAQSYIVNSRLKIQSDWARNSASADFNLLQTYFPAASSESTTAAAMSGQGHVDINRSSSFNFGASADQTSLARTSLITTNNLKKPEQYTTYSTFAQITGAYAKLSISGRVNYSKTEYQNNATNSGVQVNLESQNVNTTDELTEIEYKKSEYLSFYISAAANQRSYNNSSPLLLNRDSSGYNVDVGFNITITNLLRARIGIGYFEQDFDDNRIRNYAGPKINADIFWSVTRLTDVTFTAKQAVEDSGILNSGGLIDSTIQLNVNHELLRNLILTVQGQYQNVDFRSFPRIDERSSLGLSSRILVNRSLNFIAGLNWIDTSSSGLNKRLPFSDCQLFFGATYTL